MGGQKPSKEERKGRRVRRLGGGRQKAKRQHRVEVLSENNKKHRRGESSHLKKTDRVDSLQG